MNLEKAVELYEVERDRLARVLDRHQSYPHESIGFQEYREIPDSQVLRDDDEHFIIRVTPESWDYEMRHLMDEDMDIGCDPDLNRALQKLYTEEAYRILGRDTESRVIVFEK
jgi:hypothetical protein